MTDFARQSQVSNLAAVKGPGDTGITQVAVLAAYAPPSTKKTQSSQITGLATRDGRGIPQSSQIALLVSWKTGPREILESRAWTFDFDGHPFYVLSLGEEGTFVYDISTGEWAEWVTEGLPTWNMEQGITWNGQVVAGDNQNPTVWKLDPDSELDDGFKPMTRIITAGVPLRGRSAVRQGALFVTASAGFPTTATSTMELRFSDDFGNTWCTMTPVSLTDKDFDQEIAWYSLGIVKAPGRIFEIKDIGGVIRIDGVDASLEGEDA